MPSLTPRKTPPRRRTVGYREFVRRYADPRTWIRVWNAARRARRASVSGPIPEIARIVADDPVEGAGIVGGMNEFVNQMWREPASSGEISMIVDSSSSSSSSIRTIENMELDGPPAGSSQRYVRYLHNRVLVLGKRRRRLRKKHKKASLWSQKYTWHLKRKFPVRSVLGK